MTKKTKNLIIFIIIAFIIVIAADFFLAKYRPITKNENAPATPAQEQPAAQNLKVTLEAGDAIYYQTKVRPGATVYQFMNDLSASHGLKFSAKEYPGMGALVEEIDGVRNDVKANKFWFYYINGQEASEGISSYVLKDNDVIIWKYEESKF